MAGLVAGAVGWLMGTGLTISGGSSYRCWVGGGHKHMQSAHTSQQTRASPASM